MSLMRGARVSYLFAFTLSVVFAPAAWAATFNASGLLYAAYPFPGNYSYVYNESYSATGFAATGGGRLLNDQGQSVPGTSLHGQANSLTDRGVLRSHAYAQMIRSVGTASTPSAFEIGASATSDMTIGDLRITGPGSSTTLQLNFDLHGAFSTGTMFVAPEWNTSATNYVGVNVIINGTSVASGEYRYSSSNGSAPTPSGSGILEGFDGSDVLQTNPIVVPTNTPLSLRIMLQTAAGVSGPTERGLNLGANTDFGSTLTFATSGPVFTFAGPGFTANSTEGGIVDNTFVVPEPGAMALVGASATVVALRRPRTPRHRRC